MPWSHVLDKTLEPIFYLTCGHTKRWYSQQHAWAAFSSIFPEEPSYSFLKLGALPPALIQTTDLSHETIVHARKKNSFTWCVFERWNFFLKRSIVLLSKRCRTSINHTIFSCFPCKCSYAGFVICSKPVETSQFRQGFFWIVLWLKPAAKLLYKGLAIYIFGDGCCSDNIFYRVGV